MYPTLRLALLAAFGISAPLAAQAQTPDLVRLGNLKFAHYGAVSYMKEACATVAEDLRYQYVLGFETQGTGKNAFRSIQVEVRNRKVKQVLSRKGYQGYPPAVK